ncbi:MAG: hypothetical protein ED557_10460 [Balneola sp.]|nr:MAG: hypothetical protein ED557_10460 [Balneola sp.]
MKKFRSYTSSSFILSLLLSLALMIPAQDMMLLCDMMSNDHEVVSSAMKGMDHHDQKEDCDSMGMGNDSESENTHCDAMLDCNCIEVLAARKNAVISAPMHINISFSLIFESFDTSISLSSIKEVFPPPIWRQISYSPPDLFLENESFLI